MFAVSVAVVGASSLRGNNARDGKLISGRADESHHASRGWDDADDDSNDGDDMIHGDDLHHKTDPSDISTHGLLHNDDVNSEDDVEKNGEDEEDSNAEENEDADSADNTWHSEDTPEDDSFLQKMSETKRSKAKAKKDWDDDDLDEDDPDDMIHGDDLHHKTDPTDISTHGLLHNDDVNSEDDVEENGEDEDDSNAEENEDADSADNTWHSEDTPEDDA